MGGERQQWEHGHGQRGASWGEDELAEWRRGGGSFWALGGTSQRVVGGGTSSFLLGTSLSL